MNIKTKNEKRKLNSSQESLHSITVYSFENELIRTEYNKSNVTTVIMQMRKNIFQLCEKVDDNFFFLLQTFIVVIAILMFSARNIRFL